LAFTPGLKIGHHTKPPRSTAMVGARGLVELTAEAGERLLGAAVGPERGPHERVGAGALPEHRDAPRVDVGQQPGRPPRCRNVLHEHDRVLLRHRVGA
jgi:hypothetical protein